MKYYGDIPQADVDLMYQLQAAEHDTNTATYLTNSRKAQVYVCLAHDWYSLYMEEQAERLLLKAEHTYPGYFKDKINQHAKEDPDFGQLVQNISTELKKLVLTILSGV